MRRLILCLIVVAGLAATGLAGVPTVLNYQGRIVKDSTNYHGNGSFRFALGNSDFSVTYWSNDGTPSGEPTNAVLLAVNRGLFSVTLGDTNLANMFAIPGSVFTNASVWIRTWFDGGDGSQQLAPDQRLVSAPFAIRSRSAVTADNGILAWAEVDDGGNLLAGSGIDRVDWAEAGSYSVVLDQTDDSIAGASRFIPAVTTFVASFGDVRIASAIAEQIDKSITVYIVDGSGTGQNTGFYLVVTGQ